MSHRTRNLILTSAIGVLLAGCATPKAPPHLAPTSRPTISANAAKTLDQIEPLKPIPAATAPATRPALAPLDSLQLYAQARAALDKGERFTAVQLLDQALQLDPDSFELNLAMGRAAAGTTLTARSLPALERAMHLNPASPEPYIEIGRLQLQRGNAPAAIAPLRQVQATADYREGGDAAIAADFYLARALQLAGYDTAALNQYESLLNRIAQSGSSYRGPLEIMQIIRSPDLLFGEIATLAGRLGEYKIAISAIDQALLESPGNRQYAITRVHLLQEAGRSSDARKFAVQMVSDFGPSVEVLSVVREVFAGRGGDVAATAALQDAFNARPSDANVGYALADYLLRSGKSAQAQSILATLVSQLNYRPDAVAHLFDFYESQGRSLEAARLVIEASSRRPEDLSEQAARMSRLSRLSRSNHLRLRDVQELSVPTWAEPARLYWAAQLGAAWGRDESARAALEKAVRLEKPYRPAYRNLLNHYWARRDWDDMRKAQMSQSLVELAKQRGDAALAYELRGMLALRRKQPSAAAAALLEAMRDGKADPELLLGYASVQLMRGNLTETERILLKLNEDYPHFEPAYSMLIQFYLDRGVAASALRTLQRWLAEDPQNASAQLWEASIFLITRRTDAAEKVLLKLFDENADNQQVLISLQQLYDRSGRLDAFVRLLEQKRQGRPDIREIAERLVDIYQRQSRLAEASRVLDDLHKSAGGDSDLLYYLAHLYQRLNDNKSAEAALDEVLAADPNHASAANDLGYFLADSNRHLERAQSLIEVAVKEEPDNQAYLDSFGWVMYKRGRFETARQYLEKAIAQTVNPDPIVLDHLGDACYRLGQEKEAIKMWEESSRRLGEPEELAGEYRILGLQLQNKLQSCRRNQPAQTAATAAEAANNVSNTTAP